MAEAWKKLAQQEVGTASGTIYTVPAATETIIKHIRVVSTDASDRTLTLWHGTAGDTTIILPAVTILTNGWAEFDGNIIMAAAEIIAGDASAANTSAVRTGVALVRVNRPPGMVTILPMSSKSLP